jgi:hypothetical protein
MTRQCWTNLVLTAVICKVFVWHILCKSDAIISGFIASESETVSNEVEGMWKEVFVMSLEGMQKTKKMGQNDWCSV